MEIVKSDEERYTRRRRVRKKPAEEGEERKKRVRVNKKAESRRIERETERKGFLMPGNTLVHCSAW